MRKWKTFITSFSFRLALIFLLCNLSILSILGYAVTNVFTANLTGEVESYTEKTLDQATLTLDTGFSYIRSSLIMLANNDTVVNCMSEPMDAEQQLTQDRAIKSLLENLNLYQPVIQNILLVGKAGYINDIDSKADLVWNYPYTKTAWFRKATDDSDRISLKMIGLHPQDFYNPYVLAGESAKSTASMSIVVRDSHHRVIGAVICDFNLAALGKQLMQSNYEKNGKIALVDSAGTIIAQNGGNFSGSSLGLSARELTAVSGKPKGSFQGILAGEKDLILFNTSSVAGWKLISYIPIAEIAAHSLEMKQVVVKALVLSLLIYLLLSVFMLKLVERPIRRLLSRLDAIDGKNLALPAGNYTFSELDRISTKFSELLEHLQNTIEHDYKSQIMLEKANFHALQAQINPHFLFNMLQLLQTEVLYENTGESNAIIVSLSRMLHYTLHNTEETVTVERELHYVEDYLGLFEKRYEGRLKIRFDIADEVLRYSIPKLLLQPVVENCMRHGLHGNFDSGHVSVAAFAGPDDLYFVIEDDGAGIAPEALRALRAGLDARDGRKDGIGLRNVQKRIRILYGDRFGLSVESVKNRGTKVTVHIGKEEVLPDETSDCG